MKRFNKFTEDIDKVGALKARQKAAVSKFKSSSQFQHFPDELSFQVLF